MKRIAPISLLVAACLFAGLLCGCAPPLTHAYEEEEISFSEPFSPTSVEVKGKSFSLEGARVIIDDAYSEGEQEIFLSFAESALAYLAPQGEIRYIVGKQFASRTDGETVYLGTLDETVFLHTTLQYLGSPQLNYGLLWGASQHIRKELGKYVVPGDSLAALYLQKTPALAGLDAPFFFSPYASSLEAREAETVAFSFVEWLFRTHGDGAVKALLESDLAALGEAVGGERFAAFEKDYSSLINAYLSDMGVGFTFSPRKYFVRYSPFSQKYPLKIETDWGELYAEADYVSPYADNPWYSQAEAPYSDLSSEGLVRLVSEMDSTARKMLDDFSMSAEDLLPKAQYVLDDLNYSLGIGGQVFDGGDGVGLHVDLASFAFFAHEFCHVIFSAFGFYQYYEGADFRSWRWLSEGMATYMGEAGTPDWAGLSEGNIKVAREAPEYAELYARIRPSSQSDLRAFNDTLAYSAFKQQELSDSDGYASYEQMGSFFYWLVEKYGFDTIVGMCKAPGKAGNYIASKRERWREWGENLYARFDDEAPQGLFDKIY